MLGPYKGIFATTVEAETASSAMNIHTASG